MRRFLVGCGLGLALGCAGAEPRAVVAAKAPAVRADSAREREQAAARELVMAGDATLKANVDGAIEKYEQALQRDAVNVDALSKLSLAYEKKEDWERVAATLARAVTVAPGVVAHWRRRGNALIQLAREHEGNDYESARAPLAQCLKLDAKQADCAFLLGEVEEWADNAQAAAERYTQAVQQDVGQAAYYRALAPLYRVFKQPGEAERVLAAGMAKVEPTDRDHAALARMSVSLAQLAAARHDVQAAQGWLEKAEMYADERSPEVVYEIGSIYAAEPGNREKALRILNQFIKRTCRGSAAEKFKEPCQLSSIMIQMLSIDAPTPRAVAPIVPPPAVVPLLPGMPVPKLEMQPQRAGAAYTVWGAAYALRSRQHRREVADRPVVITGYVVKTNFAAAPRCAVHRGGVADPENCRAEIPAFWLGDRLDAPESDCIKVMGFASNFAQLFDAIRQADSAKGDEPYNDTFWGGIVPNPLPARGAKLAVSGIYSLTFAKASSGAESDPTMGILDFADREVLEPAPTLETLPGVTRHPRGPYVVIPAGRAVETRF